MRRLVILVILLLTPLLAPAQNRSGMGDIRELWDANCASCHGADGSGGMASSLLDDEWVNGGSDEELAASIRDGMPNAGMPGWSEALDDSQIRAQLPEHM